MIKDVTIGQYVPRTSVVHRSDPRTKILLTVVFMTTVLLINTYLCFLIYALFTILAIVISGIPIYYTLRGLKPVLFIIIFTAVINILFAGSGKTIFKFGIIHVTYGGLDATAKMALTISLLVVGASLLTFTTTPILLTDGIEKLMGPLKKIGVPVHEIAMMMTIALRFIPTLMEETDKIMKAQASRGADFESGNLIQRAKSFIPVLIPLFVSAFRRAEELATAMEARCYRGSEGRTRMRQLKISSADYQILFGMLIISMGTLFLNYM